MDMKPHSGFVCPVDPNATVIYTLGDGEVYRGRAGDLNWGPGAGPDGEGRILHYEVVNPRRHDPEKLASEFPTAGDFLRDAGATMDERAKEYDQPGGERNMAATVVAFNAITGLALSESQGWLFMELLKARRDFATPGGHADSQRDRVAYAALAAEARRAGR